MTDTRSNYDSIATTYLWIAGVVFAVVVLAVLYVLLRYRAGRETGHDPRESVDAPRTETAFVVGLAIVAAFLIALTFRSQDRVNALTPSAGAASVLRVDVVGAQWRWRFRYPGSPAFESTAPPDQPAQLVVPAGRRIAFTARSQDVLHDFWIPDLKFQRQVWPDHDEHFGLVFPHPGRYVGVCAWFCGQYHPLMRFVARALPPAQFDAWLARERSAAR